ncbi:MAG: SpoIIE family protein phosphatase [Ilumatobacteraceae bacterium]
MDDHAEPDLDSTPDTFTRMGGRPARFEIANLMPQLIWSANSDGVVDYYNSRVELYMGASKEPDGSWRWAPLVHDEDVGITMAAWGNAVVTRQAYQCEHRVHMADGTYRWHLSRAEAVLDANTGTTRWYGTATDVHEQKVAEERLHAALEQLQLLQSVTATMSALLWSEDDVVEALLRDGLPAAGAVDGAVVLVRAGGDVDLRSHSGPTVTSSLRALLGHDGSVLMAALRDQCIATGADETDATVAVVPFPAALGVDGGLCVVYAGAVELSASRRAALRTVAELGAQGLLRARAYELEQRRADQAEALQALATALAAAASVEEVARSIALHAGRSAGADFANVAIPLGGGRRLRLVHAPTLDTTVASAWPDLAVDAVTPLSDAFRTGRPVFVGSVEQREVLYPSMKADTEKAGFVATASVPARSQDGVMIGAVGFAWERSVVMDEDLAVALDTVVSLCAQAMQRAALSEAERQRRAFIERIRAAVTGLAAAVTLDEVAQLIVDRGALALGATAAVLFESTDTDVDVVASGGVDGDVDAMLGDLARHDGVLRSGARSDDLTFVGELVVVPLGSTTGPDSAVALHLGEPIEWQRHGDRLSSLGTQWSQALERARNHDAEQALHRRTQQLQRLTAALAQATRTADVLEVVQHQLAPAFGARAARLSVDRSITSAVAPVAVPLDPSDPGGDQLELDRDLPLDADERRSAEAFVVQCFRALARTRLVEREHQIATQLQHALLGDVDRIDGLAVGTLYLASEEGLDIGGDWYDVVRRDERTAVLVIGDVVGHSLGAATAMGQLRSAVRALAHLCAAPDELLDRVAAYSENVRNARYSTLALVYLDVPSGAFDYVCAGHPLPLLVESDGTSRFLDQGRNGPLGAFPTAVTRSGSDVISPGGSLVLYTDGLVEHRGRTIDDGMDEVALLVADRRHLPAELLAPHVADAVFASVAPRDDVAVLVVSPLVEPCISLAMDASPTQLGTVRHQMRDWMRDLGTPDDQISDVLLVAGEAIANAVEHAYHGRPPGLIHVRLERTDHEHRLTVSDEGGWRWPPAPGKRGRGTAIMQAVADRLIVERRGQGTTLHATLGHRA